MFKLAFVCDICGSEELPRTPKDQPSFRPSMKLKLYPRDSEERQIDMCDDCNLSLQEWAKTRASVPVNTTLKVVQGEITR